MFAGLADNPNLNLAHMKRQLNNLQVILFPCLTSKLSMHKCKVWCEMDWCKLSPISSFARYSRVKHTISISIHRAQIMCVYSSLAKVFVEREARKRIIRTREVLWTFFSPLLALPSNPFKHQVSEVYRFEIANRKLYGNFFPSPRLRTCASIRTVKKFSLRCTHWHPEWHSK